MEQKKKKYMNYNDSNDLLEISESGHIVCSNNTALISQSVGFKDCQMGFPNI
jgi:hypothetical protein